MASRRTIQAHIARAGGAREGDNEYLRDVIFAAPAKPSRIISHRIRIDAAPDACDKFDRRAVGFTKVVIKFDQQKAA